MNTPRQELLARLAELSDADPELRFGQMIANLATLAQGPKVEAVWDVEDDELLAAAMRLLGHYQTRQAKAAS
jgi:hypothetical protein